MTRTGHNDVREPDDFYRTEAWCVRSLFAGMGVLSLAGLRVLDPGCGDGAITEVVKTYNPYSIVGVESHKERADKARAAHEGDGALGSRIAIVHADFFEWSKPADPFYDLIIGNPPFKFAMEFVVTSLGLVKAGGAVAMLLRLPWLASQERSEWLRRNTPGLYVLPKRPQFVMSIRCRNHVSKPASKRKTPSISCTYEEYRAIDAERPSKCPLCEGPLSISTSDATDYAWFLWNQNLPPTVKILTFPAPEPRRARAKKG